MLSLGCTNETWIFGSDPGVAGMGILGRNVISLMFQGQSHAALGTAKILTGHPHNGNKVWRYSPKVPAGTFAMDNTGQIKRLAGLGEAEAREALPELRQIFLNGLRETFAPDHVPV